MFSRRTRAGAGLVGLAVTVSLASCGPADDSPDRAIASPAQQGPTGDFAVPVQHDPGTASATRSGEREGEASGQDPAPALPGLGPETSAQIPAETTQALVVASPYADSESGELRVYRRTGDEWEKVKTFATHNGSAGWLADRREGDKTSPIGVFTLSDAGGYAENPGTKLPYTRDKGLSASASVAYGPEYERVFDYVIAIDYNRTPGTPPTDRTRPLGKDRGGGIWLHLDHDSGTNGCVTLKKDDLVWLLENLDPEAHPRIAMGPAAELAK
jgi:L,D-peptidoglycan transpeptidase YkuD (ErfK/YbiS/YcfS/YnhG family)